MTLVTKMLCYVAEVSQFRMEGGRFGAWHKRNRNCNEELVAAKGR